MALKKKIKTEQGVAAEYWRTKRIISKDLKEQNKDIVKDTRIIIEGYLDEKNYKDGSKPLHTVERGFKGSFIQTRESAYRLIKGLEEFKNSEDC